MEIEYYSQFGQDEWLIENVFNYKENGYFIDCGCGNPTSGSNTYCLEKFFDWDGIGIDLNISPDFPKIRKCKSVQAVLSSRIGELKKISFQGCLSGIMDSTSSNYIKDKTNAIEVYSPTITLTEILSQLNAPNEIDYFSLDVEGHELEVLKGIDFSTYKFNVFGIEAPPLGEQTDNLNSYLQTKGYKKLTSPVPRDLFYVPA
tara:strand:- start:5611 stop:6216 length:606 start_codon:yes stop_codon:yes gene_type:complete